MFIPCDYRILLLVFIVEELCDDTGVFSPFLAITHNHEYPLDSRSLVPVIGRRTDFSDSANVFISGMSRLISSIVISCDYLLWKFYKCNATLI